jgi:hypothetical protein
MQQCTVMVPTVYYTALAVWVNQRVDRACLTSPVLVGVG